MPQLTNLAQKIVESPNFQSRYSEIQSRIGKKRLSFNVRMLSSEGINKLLLQGSVLALSTSIDHKRIAQKINSLLHEYYPDQEVINYAVQVISSRLGNYPVIGPNSQVFGEFSITKPIVEQETIFLSTEIQASLYDEEETARLEIRDKVYHFNLYQKEILQALSNNILVSFSAPTSFGKSFVVRNHIAKRYALGNVHRVLIIVPTKSLIDDFYEAMARLKSDLQLGFNIYTHARGVEENGENGVFILTQERLSFLIEKNPAFVSSFQLVYCDEAQYISRGYRGFVLRRTLKEVIRLCGLDGGTQFIFTSPLIKNPDYYQKRFFPSLQPEQHFHKEVIYSPVEKNIHFVTKNSEEFTYSLFKDSPVAQEFYERLDTLGSLSFPPNLIISPVNMEELSTEEKEVRKKEIKYQEIGRDIHIVLSSNLKSGTILYTTSPLNAHEYANEFSKSLSEKTTIDPTKLNDLRQYIADHYHESFGLIDLIKKGVGLHYGKMPIGLRRSMVSLFEEGVIDYLICTSTLLEGVNLPAKNICIFSNKHNGNSTHSALSFWNLVGRAGRMGFGLSGNVFCIADKVDKYIDLFENRESEITDPENDVAENKTKRSHVVSSFVDTSYGFKYTASPNRNDIEYLIYELLTSPQYEDVVNRFNLSEQDRDQLLIAIRECKNSLTIPFVVLKKNPGIDPRLQNQMLLSLQSLKPNQLRVLLELSSNPLTLNKTSLGLLLTQTSNSLFWPLQHSKFNVVDSTAGKIAQWLHETSISMFIQQALNYYPNITPIEKIDKALGVMEKLDSEISFAAPKYLKCFYDIAIYEAEQKGMPNTEVYPEKVEAFLFAVESGISSVIGRKLFERGVSRPIAIKVNAIFEEYAGGSVPDNFFSDPETIRRLKEGLSTVAFNELMEHLNS